MQMSNIQGQQGTTSRLQLPVGGCTESRDGAVGHEGWKSRLAVEPQLLCCLL